MSEHLTNHFRAITLSDKSWMDRCRGEEASAMTVLSFPAVFTWQSSFGLTVAGDDSFYVVKSEADEGYYYPVGAQDACRSCVLSLLNTSGRLKFLYVPERELEWLESLGFEISCEPDTSEYVYSSRSLALLDNKAGTNYRVKVRHFSRDNHWSSRAFSFPQDEDLLRQRISEWETSLSSPFPSDEGPARHSHSSDRLALLACAEDPAAIGLSGIYIETDTGDWAFLLGYRSTPQIYDMSIVKYSPGISRNAVPVCICETAKLVCSEYPYINLEDDLGDPGLRNMKKLYHPLYLLDSYSACI